MFNPRDYKNVEEYIASICTNKHFNYPDSLDEEMECRQDVLRAFEEHKKALAERTAAYRRQKLTADKDRRTIRREQKEFKRADKTYLRAHGILKDFIFRIADMSVDVEWGSDPDRLAEIYIERMMLVDEASRSPKQSGLDSRLSFHVDEAKARKEAEEASKNSNGIEDKDQELTD